MHLSEADLNSSDVLDPCNRSEPTVFHSVHYVKIRTNAITSFSYVHFRVSFLNHFRKTKGSKKGNREYLYNQ